MNLSPRSTQEDARDSRSALVFDDLTLGLDLAILAIVLYGISVCRGILCRPTGR